jgi:hypothetical protein
MSTSSRTKAFWAKTLTSRTWKQESASTSNCTTTLLKEARKQSNMQPQLNSRATSRTSQQSPSSSSSPFMDDLQAVESNRAAI